MLGFRRGLPKTGRGYDELDADLRFSHEAGANAGDAAQQFLSDVRIFDTNDLVHLHGRGQQNQGAVIVHNDGFGIFRQGLFACIAQPDNDRDALQHSLASPAVLRANFRDGSDDCHAPT